MLTNPLTVSPGHKHVANEIGGLGTSATVNIGTTANKVVALDSFAKLPAVDGSQLLNLPTDLTRGDVFGPPAGMVDNNEITLWGADSQNIKGSGMIFSDLTDALDAYAAHLLNTNNPHMVTALQIGLGNVDNTSDVNKPISTATNLALNTKADKVTTYTMTQVDSIASGKQATLISGTNIKSIN